MHGLVPNSTDVHMWTSVILQMITARKNWNRKTLHELIFSSCSSNKDPTFRVKKYFSCSAQLLIWPWFLYGAHRWGEKRMVAFCQIRGSVKSETERSQNNCAKMDFPNCSFGRQSEHALSSYILIKFSSYTTSIHSCIWPGFWLLPSWQTAFWSKYITTVLYW